MKEKALYRIIDFETFVDLMLFGKERYVNPQKWKDTYEGHLFKLVDTKEGRRKILEILYNCYGKDEMKIVNIFGKIYSISGCYAQCWSETAESSLLWSSFSYGNHAIRIGTTEDKIKSALEDNKHSYGKIMKIKYDLDRDDIEYKRLFEEMQEENSLYFGFIHKRPEFSQENEYRSMYILDVLVELIRSMTLNMYTHKYPDEASNIEEIMERVETVYKYGTKFEPYNYIRVDIKDYIDSVLVHPLAEDWYIERVKKICEKMEIADKFQGKSSLYEDPSDIG